MPRRAKPPELHLIEGTKRPGRKTARIVAQPRGEPAKPDWLSDAAAEIWEERVDTYARRGQSVVGLETMLGHYCEMDAACRELWQGRKEPTAAMLTQLRLYATEFYDTPASQVRRVPVGPSTRDKTPEERFGI